MPKIDGLKQNCSNSIANILELPKSCTRPSKYFPSTQIPDLHTSFQYTWPLSQHKDCLSRYGDFCYKDKMVVRPSYLYTCIGNLYTIKAAPALRSMTNIPHFSTLAPRSLTYIPCFSTLALRSMTYIPHFSTPALRSLTYIPRFSTPALTSVVLSSRIWYFMDVFPNPNAHPIPTVLRVKTFVPLHNERFDQLLVRVNDYLGKEPLGGELINGFNSLAYGDWVFFKV